MKQALVVGGFHKHIMGTFREKLKPYGVEIQWHVAPETGGDPYTGIPVNCEVLIVMTDCVGHPLSVKALEDGKAAGVPCVFANQKWARAEESLKTSGIIKEGTDMALVVPSPDLIKKTAVQFLVDESKKNPRTPTLEEIDVAVRKVLKSDAISIPRQWLKEIMSMAQQKGFTFSDQDIRDAVRAEVETNLETLWNFDLLGRRLMDQFGAVLPGHSRILKDEVTTILKEWALPNGCQTPAVRDFRYRSLRNWLKTRIELSQSNGGKGWPSITDTVAFWHSHGIMSSDKTLLRLRVDILGDWAKDIERLSYIQSQFPNLDIKGLCQKKLIKAVLIPWKTGPVQYWTSKKAVEDYLEGLKKAPVVETPVPPKADPVPPKVVIPESKVGFVPISEKYPPVAVPEPKMFPSSDNLALAAMVTEDVTKKLEDLLTPIRNQLEGLLKVPAEVPDPAKKAVSAVLLEKLDMLIFSVGSLVTDVANIKQELATIRGIPTGKDLSDSLAETLRTAEHYEIRLSK